MTTCPECNAEWGGLFTCHCTLCHETFAGITAFDAHRVGSARGTRRCVLPPEADLRLTKRDYPCWGLPREDETV